jgi:hypothetical protein
MRGVPECCDLVTKVLDPTGEDGWDSKVASMHGVTFFHGSAWAAVLRDSYGFSPRYLAIVQAGIVRGLLPLFESSSWLAGSRGVSLPFTDECSPLASSPGQSTALVEAALTEGKRRQWRFVEFRGEIDSLGGQPESQSFLGHRLSLTAPVGKLFEQLDDSVRRAIQKSERSGVQIEVSTSLEAIETFYQLHCRTRRRHGLPPQPFSFFRNIHRHILGRGQGFLSLARHAGRPIAASVFFHFGTKALYKFGASDERFQQLRCNNLVMWEAIKRLANQGFEELTFGRTSPGEGGLRRFKLGWGAEEYPIAYRRYDFSKQQFVSTKDRAHGWHNHLFRAMPLPILRFAGARLYRHLI